MSLCVLWDNKMTFHRLVEDITGFCDAVTPLMLSAPFYRGKYSGMIIPTGFGNTSYSKLLPALRACSDRIENYLENGGKLLVFGAADSSPNRYDWLPIEVDYHFEFMEHKLEVNKSLPSSKMFDGYDADNFACDGWFTKFEGTAAATAENGCPVLIECQIGKGTLILASTHEYPSNSLIEEFAKGENISF